MAPRDESFIQQADPPPGSVLKRDPMAVKDKLRMDVLKRIIPDECFHKSLVKSLFYMVRDMGLICALWKAYPVYVEGNWPLTFVWWNAMGFMMWALFVVGHDCCCAQRRPLPRIRLMTVGHMCGRTNSVGASV
eukprot:TRINITY_DN1675_c0_g1_i5.p1 TRINITY_DN1675_c0_g1~~TRINITY_DN1675_c0_g1_i5.p1  ORF type:complete len:133 (-),score=21.88 TRINITY_DN1675_c0_g1_i5:285-683(-)